MGQQEHRRAGIQRPGRLLRMGRDGDKEHLLMGNLQVLLGHGIIVHQHRKQHRQEQDIRPCIRIQHQLLPADSHAVERARHQVHMDGGNGQRREGIQRQGTIGQHHLPAVLRMQL